MFRVLPVTMLLAGLAAAMQPSRGQDAVARGEIDTMPVLRLEAGGPTAFVAALALNTQGNVLYAGGWDKVVRAWIWNPATRQFSLDSAATYRVPVGPGLEGVINAVAISPDGTWLAVGGRGLVRGASDQRHPGWKVPSAGAMTQAMRLDQGTIYLFNTRTREVRTLRGHTAPVVGLAFSPAQRGKSLALVSAGQEWDAAKNVFVGSVRAWNAIDGTYLGGVNLPDPKMRPGIAAWHSGAGARQLRVGIAWGDTGQQLRVWDLETGAVRTARDGQFNSTLAWWPETSTLVTGSTGRIKLWSVPPGAAPVVQREIVLGELDVPRALALFSSQERGRIDRAAVVVKSGRGEAIARLKAVDLPRGQLVSGADLALWDATGIAPSVAGSAGGAQLAVAGNPAHEIASVSAAALLSGRAMPTMLRGAGTVAGDVGFVAKGEALGIWVGRAKKAAPGERAPVPRAGDHIFDPAQRRKVEPDDNWQPSQPLLEGWRVEVADQVLRVSNVGQNVGEVRLPAGRQLTDYALLRPRAPLNVPLLAVASHELGQPLVELYDASTGAAVRELSGHAAAVHALAFSGDGRLLVSAAGDRMICVWNLADLDQVIGVRGKLPGLALEARDGGLALLEIAVDSPYRQQLEPGDLFTHWREAEREVPLTSPVDFYLRVSRIKPGDLVKVTRKRGARSEEAQLRVGQGTDERKPLASLFFSGQAARDWIGWSPLGPYESSGAAAEQLLGWHFNTGEVNPPARFAVAAEYRHLRREGLLEQLLTKGELADELPPRLERPSTSIRLKQPGVETIVANGLEPLRWSGGKAELQVELRGLESDEVASVSVKIGDAKPLPLAPAGRNVWTVELAELPADRSEQPLKFAIVTREREPQTFYERAALVLRPVAPQIEQLRPAAEFTAVRNAAARVQALVRAPAGGEFAVRLTHVAGSTVVAERTLKGKGTLAIDERLELREGDNAISLAATNADAPGDAVDRERTIVVRRFAFSPEPVLPPRLDIVAVTVDGSRRPLESDQSEPLVVTSPQLTLEGAITAPAALASATLSLGDQLRPLTGFAAGRDRRVTVNETLALNPGVQRVACNAQGESGPASQVALKVDYRPALPEVAIIEPEADSQIIEGRDERQVKLVGRLEPLDGARPFKAVVYLNGKPLDAPPAIAANEQSLSQDVVLEPGENTLEIRLSNQWGAQATTATRYVQYLRPPRIVSTSAPERAETPLVDVKLVVESPADRELSAVEVNGLAIPLDGAQRAAEKDIARYEVVAHGVPIVAGVNEIRARARNDDGWSLEAKAVKVELMQPPPPLAEIEWTAPRGDRTVQSPHDEVKFVVKSSSRLQRVELHRGETRLKSFDVAGQQESAAGNDGKLFTFQAAATVELEQRENRLRAIAVNDGGQATAEVVVTYVRKPVEIVIDRIESIKGGLSVLAERQEGGQVRFLQPSAEGSAWLHGRVRWPDAAAQQENPASVVQVWVNGFLQAPVMLKGKKPGELEWNWRARVRLNRGADNEVSVRLPDLVRSSDSRTDFRLACAKPDERQRLHLLVVGVGESNARQLETLALKAVRGKRDVGDVISTPVFERGWIYLLSGYINRGRITAQLERIQLRLGDATDVGADVVMVYYRGQETLDEEGRFYLLTSQSRFDPDLRASAVSGRDLSQRFANVPGAQLFLLDVERRTALGADQNDRLRGIAWPTDRQMAALRYAWLSSEAAPADARLLVAVDNAVPRASRLGEIADEVARDSERVTQKYGATFQYEPRVPDALRYLMLVRPTAVN